MLGRKVIYVRCIKCSYNNVPNGIRLLDKNIFLFIQENFIQVRGFERYISSIGLKLGELATSCYAFVYLISS